MTTNRITPYEAGWLQMLLDRGLASGKDLRDAQGRVALAAVDALLERKRRRLEERRKKRRKEE